MITPGKCKVFALALIFPALIGFLSAKFMNKIEEKSISCTSDYISHLGKEVLRLSINYNMNAGHGFVTMNGGLYENDIKKNDVNLVQSFTYTYENENFIFKHNKNDVFELNDSDVDFLRPHLFDFFIKKDSGPHRETISKLMPGVWIFTISPTPYLICTSI